MYNLSHGINRRLANESPPAGSATGRGGPNAVSILSSPCLPTQGHWSPSRAFQEGAAVAALLQAAGAGEVVVVVEVVLYGDR